MNCLSCSKLAYKKCGAMKCIKTSSSIQYRKVKDYRCTERNSENEYERIVDRYIFANDTKKEYIVRDNDILLGKYDTLAEAVKKRDNYIKKYKTTVYRRY